MKNILLIAFSLAIPVAIDHADGAVTEIFGFPAVNLNIPDGNPSGLADVQSVVSTVQIIESIKVSLEINTTFNGDLYSYLTHDTGFTVLLNRPGKSNVNPFGYDDDGLNVTFSELGSSDIHTYQGITTPNSGTPLSGEWQPDGRTEDPDSVLDTSPRIATFDSFAGLNPNGDWTLYVADLVTGDTAILNNWSLEITGETIPEPSGTLLLVLGFSALTLRRQR